MNDNDLSLLAERDARPASFGAGELDSAPGHSGPVKHSDVIPDFSVNRVLGSVKLKKQARRMRCYRGLHPIAVLSGWIELQSWYGRHVRGVRVSGIGSDWKRENNARQQCA